MTENINATSAASTGGAGNSFELHVCAHWLAMLLARAVPPVLTDCLLEEVTFQSGRLGWKTDDFLLAGTDPAGKPRRLAGQVKRGFTISVKNKECRKTVEAMWADVRNNSVFNEESDRLALVVFRGTDTLLDHFCSLLDAARAARSAQEFEDRLAIDGFLHKTSRGQADVFCKIVAETENRVVSRGEIWPLLRSLHVLSLDLASPTAQTEALDKTVLAATVSGPNPLASATATWDALVNEATKAMPTARTYKREDLPEEIRRNHSPAGGTDRALLKALAEHTQPIFVDIRVGIGKGVRIDRAQLSQRVLDQLAGKRVVVISGPPGSGKSVIAKDVVSILRRDEFVIAFRARELSQPHLDSVLNSGQIPGNTRSLAALMATQARKTVLVESVEGLLESSERSAFSDLLRLVAADPTWRMILTCRDYSTTLVTTALLDGVVPDRAILRVPLLSDEELDGVSAAEPALAIPLGTPALRRLLRNPYLLDLACRIPWSSQTSLPATEREFRALVWRLIIRSDDQPGGGMPALREKTFLQIAVTRARELSPYMDCAALNDAALEKLRQNGLVTASPESENLVAPAHDVLEDWAILHWLDEAFAKSNRQLKPLSDQVNGFPALRRAYRKWVGELAERDGVAGKLIFQEVLRTEELPPHFRDDTLVGLFHSAELGSLLRTHQGDLFQNKKQTFQRLVHLLRVACVSSPEWASKDGHVLINVPDGPAWSVVLKFVEETLAEFTRDDVPLLLGLCEDWTRGVWWKNPYPAGSSSVSKIAFFALSLIAEYGSHDARTSILKVISKIPKLDPKRFESLLKPSRRSRDHDRLAEDLREVLYEGFDGFPVVRDLPKLVISDLRGYMLASEAGINPRWDYADAFHQELLFGVNKSRHMDFFPPSAIRGPFLFLLNQHPRQALVFLKRVFDHVADWYTRPRLPGTRPRKTWPATFQTAIGVNREVPCNGDLWVLYRGLSVGPHILQCALMAMESWLRVLADSRPECLDSVLLYILKRSRSSALIGVVAGVAVAFPQLCSESLLVLLSSKDFVGVDRARLAHEGTAPFGRSDFGTGAEDGIHTGERRESDALPSRRRDLEIACLQLQGGPLAARVQALLDKHINALPPMEKQTEEDKLWRLALARMDLRKYSVKEVAREPQDEDPPTGTPLSGKPLRIVLTPEVSEPDIQTMSEQSAAEQSVVVAQLETLLWAKSLLFGPQEPRFDGASWQMRLESVRAQPESCPPVQEVLSPGRIGFVAAVCARDHWSEMTPEQQDWCITAICGQVEATADNWGEVSRVQRNELSGDRACAFVLPGLLRNLGDGPRSARVRDSLAKALTHPNDEVRRFVARGVGGLWAKDRQLALRCANLLSMEAELFRTAWSVESGKAGEDRRAFDDVAAEAAAIVRPKFSEADGVPADAILRLQPDGWAGARIEIPILAILADAPSEAAALSVFAKVASLVRTWWDNDRESETRSSQTSEAAIGFPQLLERFVLLASPEDAKKVLLEILNATDEHPEEVSRFIRGLVVAADLAVSPGNFWMLWKLFSERARDSQWLKNVDTDYSTGRSVLVALFLGIAWKDGVSSWRHLEGHQKEFDDLFAALPASASSLDAYLTFLSTIGGERLPAAFIEIAKKLEGVDARTGLGNRSSAFKLELLVQRFVYTRPADVKRSAPLQAAVLRILDVLVEHGSSAAFRMRDDFVTPYSEA